MENDQNKAYHMAPQADVLAEVLRFMGLEGNVFCQAGLSAPWGLSIPADGRVHFHHIQKGVCRLRVAREKADRVLSAGELAVLTQGEAYILFDAPGRSAVDIRDIVAASEQGPACSIVRLDGDGPKTQMLCGSFQFRADRQKWILPLLPPVFVLACEKYFSKTSLEAVLDLIAVEASRQHSGARFVLSRLVEILFVHILRSWADSPAGHKDANWINALQDDRIAPALGALHAEPAHAWTVARLAEKVNLSRSPFALRFKQAVGHTPMAYLRQLRLEMATDLLAENSLTLKEIAARVGYESEASFSKAFKSTYGVAPGRWRTRNHP